MTASDGLKITELVKRRRGFVDNLRQSGAEPHVVEEAVDRLERRLLTWRGEGIAGNSRFKQKIARGGEADCVVGADRAEMLIVRALSLTRGECQFTVVRGGVVFASEANGWTIDKVRVYVSGLSQLVDDAADVLCQMRGPNGGRMFYDRYNSFLNAANRRRFLTVVDGDEPPSVRRGGVALAPTRAGAVEQTCPTCFQILPLTGDCAECEP